MPPNKIALAGRKATSSPESRAVPIHLHRVLQDEIEKREQADEALRRAENRYQSIFEHALEGIFQTTADGKYISANPALVGMYGYTTYEELAQSINNIARQLYVVPNRRAEFVRLMQKHGQVLHFESEIRRRDGRTIWISENVRSIVDEAGKFLYYEGTVDDISELKLADAKLQKTLEALEQTQARLESELSEAAGYVRSLLPSPITGVVQADWCYLPCSMLGGDGLGYHWLDDEHFALYLLDVSGHGVGSALLSMSVLNVLRTQLLPATDYHDPSAVLEGLSRAFPMQQNNGKYFTIWYGVYNKASRELIYASGGHHAAVLIPNEGAATPLQSGGPVIGAFPDMKFPSARVVIPAQAELYVFSDGVYEIARPDGSWQSLEEFSQYLSECRPQLEKIVESMRTQHGVEEFEDDFTLLKIGLA